MSVINKSSDEVNGADNPLDVRTLEGDTLEEVTSNAGVLISSVEVIMSDNDKNSLEASNP